ncbi:MAG: YggU family protein [Gammaproteobacteria bacterium]|nr:YggU family protein [Gammaproteobacteria bacterium]
MTTASWHRWDGEDLILSVRVQPRASSDNIVGPLGDALKVRITAPPVEGRANAHLIRFLAKVFAVPKSSILLMSGDNGRCKRLRIPSPRRLPEGITPPP